MVKCWYLNDIKLENPRNPNQKNDKNEITKISWSSLAAKYGIKYWNLEVENYTKFNTFSLIKQRQNLSNEYQLKVHSAEYNFNLHMHEIDEARFVLDGQMYYDIYTDTKQIIRIHVSVGDFIIIPKYLFHRTILPQSCSCVTFLQMTQNPVAVIPSSNDKHKSIKSLIIQTYFEWNLKNNPKKFMHFSKNSTPQKVKVSKEQQSMTVNGVGYVMGGRAKALASYPHLRAYNGLLFVSGTSSRRPDNTHIGAIKSEKPSSKNDNDDDDEKEKEGQWILDIRAQTRAVLENIKVILGCVDAGLEHLLAITVFLVDFRDYNGMNEVYNEYFDGESGPTRTTVAVARLPHPNLLIEIQCTAAMPN